jgi:mono/diheme cytochrome c family protein
MGTQRGALVSLSARVRRWALHGLMPVAMSLVCSTGARAASASEQAPETAPAESGRVRLHYMQFCAGCHLPDGTGSPARGVPSMRGGILGRFMATPAGRAYLLRVPGVTNTPLNDAQTAQLMNWLITNFGDGAVPGNYPAFSATEAGDGRRNRLADPAKLRAVLLGTSAQTDSH